MVENSKINKYFLYLMSVLIALSFAYGFVFNGYSADGYLGHYEGYNFVKTSNDYYYCYNSFSLNDDFNMARCQKTPITPSQFFTKHNTNLEEGYWRHIN